MIDLFSGHSLEISLDGRIGWLGELITLGGKTFIKFNVVCHIYKNIEWVSCIAYGNKASLIDQYAQKGTEVKIKGYQKTDKWEDKQSKEIKSKKNLIVENIGFTGNIKNSLKLNNEQIDLNISDEDNEKAINYAKGVVCRALHFFGFSNLTIQKTL